MEFRPPATRITKGRLAAALLLLLCAFAFVGCDGGGRSAPPFDISQMPSPPDTEPPPDMTPGEPPDDGAPDFPQTLQAANAGDYLKPPFMNPCNSAAPLEACDVYYDSVKVKAALENLARDYPMQVELTVIGTTLEDKEIMAVKIADKVLPAANRRAVLIVGGYHAREWIAVNAPLLIAEYLARNFHFARLPGHEFEFLKHAEIYIAPLVNPDGRDYSATELPPGVHPDSGDNPRYWRKNRRPLADPDSGMFGVDPNRNHNYKWGLDNAGSSPDFHSQVYRGDAPHSEEENKAVCRLAHEISPAIAISYHNYGEVILRPWGYTTETEPIDEARAGDVHAFHKPVADEMGRLIEEVHGTPHPFNTALGWYGYPTNGDFGDWIYGVFGVPAFTIEVRPAILRDTCMRTFQCFVLPEEEITPTFEEQLPAALYAILYAVNNPADQSAIARNAAADGCPLEE